VVDRVLDVAARDLDGHANTALGELFDRRLHRTAIVPAVPRAAADPEATTLEEPDQEQDDDDQSEDATADIHRLALLSVVNAWKKTRMYPDCGPFTPPRCGREDSNL
jgi:hypothetical protein